MVINVSQDLFCQLTSQLNDVVEDGLFKPEHVIKTPQSSCIKTDKAEVLNFCANNYLGLADSPELINIAKDAIAEYGFGMASVRFICGTQDIHKELEQKISEFLKTEDTILYSSCFDANTGLFETLLSDSDAIITDALNHASIIDGVRLSKAKRFIYRHNDMAHLEELLQESQSQRHRLIVTDGVFSMDGVIADLPNICALAEKYDALVMVDDSHAVGFMGPNGRGTPEYFGLEDSVDIYTGTLGKALGGASGGYVSARKPIVQWLRQRSRPYLFSNSLAPVIVASSIKVLDWMDSKPELRQSLKNNTEQMRNGLTSLGFDIIESTHPIVPIMLGDAKIASEFSKQCLAEGVYVIGFSFPVVPKGKARIRLQLSSAHTAKQIDKALSVFAKVGRECGVIA